jgi:metal-responsive CopG/Arc/MetJ family transcriptional regulator
MKAIQITVDDRLLAQMDADPEVQQLGRSAVFRRAVEAYLSRKRKNQVGEAYRKAYGKTSSPGDELDGWADEGVWPEP